MFKVMLITKPLVPPFNDSAKVLPRLLMEACPQQRFHVLGAAHQKIDLANVRVEDFVFDAEHGALTGWQKLRLFLRLLKPDEMAAYHFFFAPNPLSSLMSSLAMHMRGTLPSVQTVCSSPKSFSGVKRWLFADETVVLSDDTLAKMQAEGVKHVRRIYPAVKAPARIEETPEVTRRRLGWPEEAVVALYAGDLEFSNAAETLMASLPEALKNPRLHVALAVRDKTERTQALRRGLKRRIRQAGLETRVSWVDEQTSMWPVLQASDVLVLNPDTLYAKMDLPLVLLEAMALGKPSIISDCAPMSEAYGDAEAGLRVTPGRPARLAEALTALAEDAGLRERLGTVAAQVARERFSLERLGRETAALYAEIAERPR